MDLHVSLIGREGLSREIHDQIRDRIVARRIRPGEALPPSRELAKRLGVSRSTITLVYERLCAEGLVVGRVGAGTFVAEHSIPPPGPPEAPAGAGALRPRSVWGRVPSRSVFGRPAELDLRTGISDGSLFPTKRWRQLMARSIRSASGTMGHYSHPGGLPELREAIVRHIAISRGVDASVDDVTVTGGTQQAIDLVSRTLLSPGDTVAMEDPGYGPPNWLFRSSGMAVRGVPVDGEGIVVEAIPEGARLVYVTPSHQYPLGVTMTLGRRTALLEWAEHNDAAIIEDDYDGEFRFRNRPTEPILTLDRSGRVVYVGSFSKSLSPKLRLGFVVTPPSLTAALQTVRFLTDWHAPVLSQAALAELIDEGTFARMLRRAVRLYDGRHEALVEALRAHLDEHFEVVPTQGGLHVAARARSATVEEVEGIVERAAEAGIALHRLSTFAVDGPPIAGLLFGYGAIATDRIPVAIRRLGRLLREV